MSLPLAKELVAKFVGAVQDERMKIVEDAQENLSGNQMKIFKKEVKKIESEEKNKKEEEEKKKEEDDEDVSSGDEEAEDTPDPTVASENRKGKGKEKKVKIVEVTESDIIKFWAEIEAMSGNDLLNTQVIQDFQYVGFDPNTILRSIIQRGRAAKRSGTLIKSDIAQMCTIAIIKGSITETNLKKMSDAGKKSYGEIEALYGLKRGGSKGVDPEVITVARVGAAFPGSMMKILLKRPDLAKVFSGPFGSKVLPSYLRHQSAAACIPETMEVKSKTFLLGLIIAYTSDQSKVISKTKKLPSEIFEDQESFITQTHSSNYPTLEVRKSIFKSWSLIADFDKLKAVGDNILKIVKDFEPVSKEDLQSAIALV